MAKGDEELDSNATVQMSPEELARLHAELAGRQRAALEEASPYAETAEKPTVRAADKPAARAEAAKKPEPKAEVAKKPEPKAATPRRASPDRQPQAGPAGGAGLLVVGGIGALLAGIAPALALVPAFQGMDDLLDLIWVGAAIGAVGHLLLGLGMFGAISRTGGIAALVGTLHVVAMIGLTFVVLAVLGLIPLDELITKLTRVAQSALPGTAWLLSGIWALSATRTLGTMGVLHGIFALIGGGAQVGYVVGDLAGSLATQDDVAIALLLGAAGGIFLAAFFLSIPMFGRLKRAPLA